MPQLGAKWKWLGTARVNFLDIVRINLFNLLIPSNKVTLAASNLVTLLILFKHETSSGHFQNIEHYQLLLNVKCLFQTFAWFSRYKRILNVMPRDRQMFVIHRLIKMRYIYWYRLGTLTCLQGRIQGCRPTPLFGDRQDFNQCHCSGNWLNLNFYICKFSLAPKLWILHLLF